MASVPPKTTFPQGDLSFSEEPEPRVPPRVQRFPLPYDLMQKPKPMVPEASLIFDSAFSRDFNGTNTILNSKLSARSTGMSHNTVDDSIQNPLNDSLNSRGLINKQRTGMVLNDFNSTPSDSYSGVEELKKDFNNLVRQFKIQESTVLRIEEKLDKIIEFQETFLSQLFKKGSAVSKDNQTSESLIIQSENYTMNTGVSNSQSVTNSTPVNKSDFREPYTKRKMQTFSQPVIKGTLAKLKYAEKNNDDDLSAILKDIELPNLNEPSVFSEVSGLKSLELQEFNDDSFKSGSEIESPILGASASAFGSNPSSDDEAEGAVKPTATFYNNVMGNVNKLLKGGPDTKMNPKTAYYKVQSPNKRSNRAVQIYREKNEQRRESSGLSGTSSSTSSRENSLKTPLMGVQSKPKKEGEGDEVVEATKRYLETLGVQFGSPSTAEKKLNLANNSKNYMIQQNVYNSIYIPTVNCIPVIPEELDSNANSGQFNTLAQKYVPQEELKQYEALIANSNAKGPEGTTETTVYGMSQNNLSFATKQYLQRYGLVNEQNKRLLDFGDRRDTVQDRAAQSKFFDEPTEPRNDRILDITAIRNQPKLL